DSWIAFATLSSFSKPSAVRAPASEISVALSAADRSYRIGSRFDATDELSALVARVPLKVNTASNRERASHTESNGRFKTCFQVGRRDRMTCHNMHIINYL